MKGSGVAGIAQCSPLQRVAPRPRVRSSERKTCSCLRRLLAPARALRMRPRSIGLMRTHSYTLFAPFWVFHRPSKQRIISTSRRHPADQGRLQSQRRPLLPRRHGWQRAVKGVDAPRPTAKPFATGNSQSNREPRARLDSSLRGDTGRWGILCWPRWPDRWRLGGSPWAFVGTGRIVECRLNEVRDGRAHTD
jgi:hypothetical protein